jgi:hypothetical protein
VKAANVDSWEGCDTGRDRRKETRLQWKLGPRESFLKIIMKGELRNRYLWVTFPYLFH